MVSFNYNRNLSHDILIIYVKNLFYLEYFFNKLRKENNFEILFFIDNHIHYLHLYNILMKKRLGHILTLQ